MANSRPILPRPPLGQDDADNGPVGSGRQGRRKTERISHACEGCRKKKVKCDGLRPVCSPCSLRETSCEYVRAAGQSKLDIATSRLEAYGTLFDALKNGSPQHRDALLQRIQSADDVLSLSHLDNDNSKDDLAHESAPDGRNLGRSDGGFAFSGRLEDVEAVSILRREQPQNPQSHLLSTIDIPDTATARGAVDLFFDSSSRLFHVFSPSKVDVYFACVFDKGDLGSIEGVIATACVSAVAAVGCQYGNGEFDQATETAFYNAARLCLDTVIEHSPLDAIGICSLLAMYNVMGKGTVALTYVEVGLSMSRMQGLYEKRSPYSDIPQTKWLEYRKTWRALLFFSSWLGATLGHVSGNDSLFGVKISDMNVDNSHDIEDIVQAELTKISLLKVTVLRLHLAFKDITELTAESIMGDLSQWHSQLPPQMHLANLGSENTSTGLRRTIYYAHLLHLGAILLIYRLIAYKAQCLPTLPHVCEDMTVNCIHRFAIHGVTAAKHSAYILDSLMADNGVFRRCWLVMFQSYTSCLTLLHTVVQEQLHGVPRADWEETLQLASKCLAVLDHCGRMDQVASRFHQTLTDYYGRVAEFQNAGTMEMIYGHAAIATQTLWLTGSYHLGAYLLHIPSNGDPQRIGLAKELLRMMCVPFGDADAKVYSERLARTPGWHPDPTCYEPPQLVERLAFDMEKAVRLYDRGAENLIERLRDGQDRPDPTYFLGSSEPHGWSFGGYSATHDLPGRDGF